MNRLILSTSVGRYWEGRIQGAYTAGVVELTARTWSYSWVLPFRLGGWHETGRHWQGEGTLDLRKARWGLLYFEIVLTDRSTDNIIDRKS